MNILQIFLCFSMEFAFVDRWANNYCNISAENLSWIGLMLPGDWLRRLYIFFKLYKNPFYCTVSFYLDWRAYYPHQVDAENMKTKNSTFVSQAQKRLAFTTKLMQYILPVLPDRLLAANAIDSCETIVYRTSRLALPDAFNPAISSVSDANNFIPTESM